MELPDTPGEGLRERKRRETLDRIAEAGLRLFIAKGYEETTLDDIAATADISRRTFFHYFRSKDQILLAWQATLVDEIRAAVLHAANDRSPLDALCITLLELTARYDPGVMLSIARLLRSSEHLRAANQGKFLQMEHAAFESLCQLWPLPSKRDQLQIVAMVGIGAFRIALDEWTAEGGEHSFADRLTHAFANLRTLFEEDQRN
jgi:AcrR family transcriptional regulator